jgi:hypothetical protein
MAYLFWLEFVALYDRFKCVCEEYSVLYFVYIVCEIYSVLYFVCIVREEYSVLYFENVNIF